MQMSASPTRKKAESPSKAPKVLTLSFEKNTELNLINMQPTKRQHNQTQEQLDMFYLTTAEKKMFDSQIEGNGSQLQTKRKHNKENELDS